MLPKVSNSNFSIMLMGQAVLNAEQKEEFQWKYGLRFTYRELWSEICFNFLYLTVSRTQMFFL